ncbi:MAG: hypothetical protein JJU06_07490 [Ectothiorhodospiraceae bacterium]|nr:hypothetical protein [Ectothiorhodospiraceae bacterium]MCH8502767.1 hypothetical protein [Ectothiorhodospiraceae bacterium]
MSGRREPVNLVWWLLAGGILLGILIDNPLDWDAELLRERESRSLQMHSEPARVREPSVLLSSTATPFITPNHRNQHVEIEPTQSHFPWHTGTPLLQEAGSR